MNARLMAMGLVALSLVLAVVFYSSCGTVTNGREASSMLRAAYPAVALFAFASAYLLYSRRWKSRIAQAWLLMSCGMGLWFLGELSRGWMELSTGSVPYPSMVDFFMLLGYAPIIAGFYSLFQTFRPGTWRPALMFAVVMIAGLAMMQVFLLPQALSESNPVTAFIGVAYPFCGFIALGLVVSMLAMLYEKPHALSWTAIAIGIIFILVADFSFSALGLRHIHDFCHPVSVFWIIGYSFLSLGALFRITAEKKHGKERGRGAG